MRLILEPTILQVTAPLNNYPWMGDARYAVPTKAWFFGEFASALKTFLEQLKVWRYRPGSRDCENFALLGLGLATLLHSRSTTVDAGIAIAEVWYFLRPGLETSGHAILSAIVGDQDGGPLELVHMEPQTQEQIWLTKEQSASCFYCRFAG